MNFRVTIVLTGLFFMVDQSLAMKRTYQFNDGNSPKRFKSATPLHDALAAKNFDEFVMLVENGTDVNEKDKDEFSILWNMMYKFKLGDEERHQGFDILVKSKVNLNVKTPALKLTPLHNEVSLGRLCWVEKLIKNGADVNVQDSTERTPLMYIGGTMKLDDDYVDREKIVKLLYKSGADFNARRDNGNTVLFRVADNKLLSDCLVLYGADIEIENNRGETAYDYSIKINKKSTTNKNLYDRCSVRENVIMPTLLLRMDNPVKFLNERRAGGKQLSLL